MRVTNNPVQNSDISKSKKADRPAPAGPQEARKGDRPAPLADAAAPEISAKGRDLAKAKSVAEQAPEVREEKIAELKRRIAAGGYKIDSDVIADRMVDEHLMSGIG